MAIKSIWSRTNLPWEDIHVQDVMYVNLRSNCMCTTAMCTIYCVYFYLYFHNMSFLWFMSPLQFHVEPFILIFTNVLLQRTCTAHCLFLSLFLCKRINRVIKAERPVLITCNIKNGTIAQIDARIDT